MSRNQNGFDLTLLWLEHGWAHMRACIAGVEREFTFEYTPNNAFGDLAYSASRAIWGTADGVQVSFPAARETVAIKLSQSSPEMLSVILDAGGNGIVSGEVGTREYARAVLRMFDRYLFGHSAEEFELHWRSPLPELQRLRDGCGKGA